MYLSLNCGGCQQWSCSVAQPSPPLYDPLDCSVPGFTVLHHLSVPAHTHSHRVGDAFHLSHPLASPLLLPSVFPSSRVFPVSRPSFSNSEVTNQWYSNSGLCVCPCVYFHWRSLFLHMVLCYFLVFCLFVFHLDLRTSFGFTYRIDLVVMNSASFCLSGNVSVKVEVVPQTCPAVHHLMAYSQPGASVCGILQAHVYLWRIHFDIWQN